MSAKENCFDLMLSMVQLWGGGKINIVRWVLPNFMIYQELQAVQWNFFFLLNTPVSGVL